MYTIKTLNAISPVGLAKLPKNQFDVTVDADAPDGILVRSADLLNTTFNDNLLAIARAGAGVNNIPLERCSEQGIVVFNTPGANANAVAELVIGMLIAGSRNVAAAAQWCQGLAGDPAMAKSVEKGKKQFVGNEIKGKTLGVIGLGAIGSRVANCAIELGMEVYGYDPYISIEAAWNLSSQVRHCVNLNDMLPLCDYITIHVPYLPTTKDTINTQTLALCKDGVKILNYARGELVNTAALLEAMDNGKVSGYMTDFPSEDILGRPGSGICKVDFHLDVIGVRRPAVTHKFPVELGGIGPVHNRTGHGITHVVDCAVAALVRAEHLNLYAVVGLFHRVNAVVAFVCAVDLVKRSVVFLDA